MAKKQPPKDIVLDGSSDKITSNEAKKNNPKIDTFTGTHEQDRILLHSVVSNKEDNASHQTIGGTFSTESFNDVIYAKLPVDKLKRLQLYRQMVKFPEVGDCVAEIVDNCINTDENGDVLHLKYNKNSRLENIQRHEIQESFEEYISLFDFENNGYNYFNDLIVDGEMCWENIVDENNLEDGIIGINRINNECYEIMIDNNFNMAGILLNSQINYEMITDNLTKAYNSTAPNVMSIYRSRRSEDDTSLKPLPVDQLTYANTGTYEDSTNTIVIPFLDVARRPYRQLSLIEDAIIVHRLVRAPERYVFDVPTGRMPPAKAEEQVRLLANKFQKKKGYNQTTGTAEPHYDSTSALESFFICRPEGSDGTKITTLKGADNLSQIDDLLYFFKKLYRSLRVPYDRFNKTDGAVESKGDKITYEELRFAKFIMQIQNKFANGLKLGFITHLKLKGLWEQYSLRNNDFNIWFTPPSLYNLYVEQNSLNIKIDNYDKVTKDHPELSKTFAMMKYLKMSPEEIEKNNEERKKEKIADAITERIIKNLTETGQPFSADELAQSGGTPAGGAAGGAESIGGGMPEGGGLPDLGGGGEEGGGAPPFGGQEAPSELETATAEPAPEALA